MPTSVRGLLTWVREHPAYTNLLKHLSTGVELPPVNVLARARPAVVAALSSDLEVPLLIIVPSVEESRHLVQGLKAWIERPERILQFPEPPAVVHERTPWPAEVITDRLNVLAKLAMAGLHSQLDSYTPPVIVASARSLIRRTLPYRHFRRAIRQIVPGAKFSLTELVRHAIGIGYEPVTVVEAPGQLSRRGGILDIFPPHAPGPYRLEFFGDEIETIRSFDPGTQRSRSPSEGFWIMPVREALPRDSQRAIPHVERLLQSDPSPEIRAVLQEDLEALVSGTAFEHLEFYLPYFYEEVSTLLSYLPSSSLVIATDLVELQSQWEEIEEETREQQEAILADVDIETTPPVPHVSWADFNAQLERQRLLVLESGEQGPLAEAFQPEVHFAGRLSEALGRIRQWLNLGDQVVIVSRQAARMAELWQEFTPPPVHSELPTPPEELITFVQGVLSGGWQWHDAERLRHLVTDEELFGWQAPEPRRRPRRRASAPEQFFADLKPGDYVVHEDYGIGIFRGLVTRSIDQIEREYLLVEYGGAGTQSANLDASGSSEVSSPQHDLLFVPIHQADRLTRYVGAEGIMPRLSRLGSGTWEETKARVKRAANELARDLLNLYARRQIVKGHAFSPDSPWQQELEASFPYVETEDQIEAIQAVKADMERPRPMDRLICGDAGYGKTEVALRAAFKAVVDGKQVAMLVPTTVLAQQHYQTFKERLTPFPVRVELLSRFLTDAEQRRVIEGLRQGTVDIVIGTHRLLQRDVGFRDLGLVIVDEEQRFGVAHKERLKKMRTEVDVLTLTATPIPRTLYMALAGVRDISIIETPPQERLPIATYIGPYSADVVRRAILREVRRGGQVFYVHNRVESIHSVAARIKQLVPEIRLGIAHGQMRERELSQVMIQFTKGELDVLLATTIIESGLDFPNANTLIVERADRFGLAQLYQLRGRVGRGTQRGYAYFFHARRLKQEARERLRALKDTASQGGGFTIALRDLEIRGAGELLGSRQHGHIAAVGFTLYTRILSQAVARLKAETAGQPLPPEPVGAITIELPIPIGLPADYIADDRLRLQLYRRLADIRSEEELVQLHAELEDRFGQLPVPAENLLFQLRLKLLAREARIPAINVESGQLVLHPPWLKDLDAAEYQRLRRELNGRARVGRRELWLPLAWDESHWRTNLEEVLKSLVAWWRRRERSNFPEEKTQVPRRLPHELGKSETT